ncbi:uncharacterized protein LOC133778192 isoform X2 [Humulus lupulus]|uniref:uncharacterized protein LOC133778192 isoform X2 n=1 Tax=Humulus lupulus TaxID=3486 RepID=UPI002B4130FA|nr:uncharacterized protein LOC133778192 isoform X2 [Humulus lupulus]
MRVAVVGAGISGLVSAYVLAQNGVEVVLYEKEQYLGGHANTVTFDGFDLDLGFMVFNPVSYPNMMEFFEKLGVEMETSDMSFSVSLDKGEGCEWGTRNGFSSLFAQKKNFFNPYFYQMIREIVKFKDDVNRYLDMFNNNPDIDRNETLGDFLKSHGYSDLFIKAYLLFGHPQWLTVKGRSHCYVKKVRAELESRGCHIRTCSEVQMISTIDEGCVVHNEDGSKEVYNKCILAVHAPDAVRLLGDQATPVEQRVLGAFQYVYSDIYLHRDKTLMPKNPAAWSAWNFLGRRDKKVSLTYWLNMIQNLGETSLPFLVTLNPDYPPNHTLVKFSTSHPVPSVTTSKASLEIHQIQGNRGIWFCGAYQGYGFHEDGLKAGMTAAYGLIGKSCDLLSNPNHMVPSLVERGARLFVTRFLTQFITAGCLIILEEGGTMFTFEGNTKGCSLKVAIKVHSSQFYWKVATQADLGLADAYVNGDFTFVDKDQGLLNLFLIFIANRDSNSSASKLNKKGLRGWWTPLLFTASIASAKYFFQHVSRQNTLTQARRNISRHYDLSNELFALFLDETMSYSSAVFKSIDEELKAAQLRKISILIEKARIDKSHEVLEIGCGWGSLAIEVVKRTGCKYTGITLSKEQLKIAQKKVKDVGLQENIKFLLCDYRQLPAGYKCDRIISCEMIEHVGHEFIGDFFGCCESVLAENGLFVLQFISIPDQRYEEYRRSSDFIKEYIFPGGLLPSLSRVTSAMTASSRLCVEHIENIGIHYYQTLRIWRKNFLEKQGEIMALGYNDKFIRTWEYYFDYCAAGFKSHTLGDYQIVFSRPGNVATFSNPYRGIPTTYGVEFN